MARSRGSTSVLLAPWLLVAGAFWFFPLAWSFALAFTDARLLGGSPRFVSFDNFARVLSDPAALNAIKVTSLFVAGTVPTTTALALLVALLLDRMRVFRGTMRTVVFVPVVTPLVVSSLVFTRLYARDGFIGSLAALSGVSPEGILHSPATALPSIMLMDVWLSIGYYSVVILAALATVPREARESAAVDGATGWRRFYASVWPYVRPAIVFAVVINTIKSFQVFVEVYVMTRGGPLGSTTTAVYHLYESAFRRGEVGYASAFAVVLFAISVGLSIAQVRALSGAGGST